MDTLEHELQNMREFSVVFAVVSNKMGNFAVQNVLVIAHNVP